MLGMSCLEYTTRHIERKNSTAGEILDQMRSVIKSTLNQEIFEDENHDAIDMALLIIDIRNMKLQFAGANRPLLIIRNGEIIRTKGDSMPVGVFLMEKEHFTNHVINLEPNDIIYVFSDGIPDQFGYREGHNESEIFNVRRFYSLLKEICGLPFEVQREKIQTTLREWSKNKTASEDFCEQTDDNLLIGLSVKDMIKATENVLW